MSVDVKQLKMPVRVILELARATAGQRRLRPRDDGRWNLAVALVKLGLPFDEKDLDELDEITTPGGRETLYALACQVGNLSYCRFHELVERRPPFLYEGKRLYEGAHFKLRLGTTECHTVYPVKVTGFGEDHRGHYVSAVWTQRAQTGPSGRQWYVTRVRGRYKLTRDDLKASARAGVDPDKIRHPRQREMREFQEAFPTLVPRYNRANILLWKKAKTLADFWDRCPDGDLMLNWLTTFDFPLTAREYLGLQEEGTQSIPAVVRKRVGDFATNLLPLVLKPLKARIAEIRAAQGAERLEKTADRVKKLAGI